jgi:hypothetical protein
MEVLKAHPNTQAMLDAWQRLVDGDNASDGPTTDEYPGLVNNLFLLNHVAERDFAFRRVGAALDRLFGRQLAEHDFLSIWNDIDRRLVAAGLSMEEVLGGRPLRRLQVLAVFPPAPVMRPAIRIVASR